MSILNIASGVTFTDGKLVVPILNERFHITSEFDLYDNTLDVIYKRDPSIALDKLAYDGVIPEATSSEPVSLTYLFALAVCNVQLPDELLFDNVSAPRVYVRSGKFAGAPSQILLQWPVGGITVPGDVTFRYIPMASNYAVSATGQIKHVPTGQIVTAGWNRSSILIDTDIGTMYEANIAELVLLAFGEYNSTNYMNSPVHKDGDVTNYIIGNLTFEAPEGTGAVISVDDHPHVLNDA